MTIRKIYSALDIDSPEIGAGGIFFNSINEKNGKTEADIRTLTDIFDGHSEKPYECEDGKAYSFFAEVTGCRAYSTTQELVDDFIRRFSLVRSKAGLPFIWIRRKDNGDSFLITALYQTECTVRAGEFKYTLEMLYSHFTFMDGSPIGKN